MKIFTSTQIHELDRVTIEKENIKSIDLMERAATALAREIAERWSSLTPIVVFAGPGNNGGDALAIARILAGEGYKVKTFLFNIGNHLSEDCRENKERLIESKAGKDFTEVTSQFDPPELPKDTLVIDGLFGNGLNKPLAGGFASLVKYINQCPAKVVSIDLPSGLIAEDNSFNVSANIIRADLTLTLHLPKLSFLFAESQQFLGEVKILDIRLNEDYIDATPAKYRIVEEQEIRSIIKKRSDFAHKGSMGNALLIAGSYDMAGAAILCGKACLRSGVGKVTMRTPKANYVIMQTALPEAVVSLDKEETIFSETIETEDFDAVGIGPGIGRLDNTAIALISQIRRTQCPLVLDADALNILATRRAWMQQLPKDIVLTPHPKELDRLVGAPATNSYERLMRASELAKSLHAYIILKGHNSALCLPDGNIVFNSTGNSGMATAGSGDVLTGIITALLARGYTQANACLLGMYLHGLAGDAAEKVFGKESLMASDIINHLPNAFKALEE